MVGKIGRNDPELLPTTALTNGQVANMLNRADIVLTHGCGLPDRVIRWFTKSYWNHAAIVFVLSDKASGSEQGYQRTFILEAEASAGVDIHPIDKYLNSKHQDMVILRFPALALPPDRRLEFLRRVRGFALEQIDAAYGYGTILQIVGRVLGPVDWLLKPIIRAIKIVVSRRKAINDFICSGVIQYAYYRACFGADLDKGDLWDPFFQDAQNRRNLIVNPNAQAVFDAQPSFDAVAEELKLTIPADFSRAAKAGLLECVAERVKGVWGEQLTHV
ncbi:MAG: YiiX/YebB-like N1pC/P60 family cysteine hydrolase [Dehalococcoidia bacterium]